MIRRMSHGLHFRPAFRLMTESFPFGIGSLTAPVAWTGPSGAKPTPKCARTAQYN